MLPNENNLLRHTRREFFGRSAFGLGALALGSLLNGRLLAQTLNPGGPAPRSPHFAPTAKRAIYLHMAGGPSHLDLFDYKPRLIQMDGKDCPESLYQHDRFAFIQGVPVLLGTRQKFSRHGRCGMELSELLPFLGGVADELCLVRSMNTDQFNHAPAQLFLHTGAPHQGRPSLGSWLAYGLGSEAHDLPAFVVMVSGERGPEGGASLWGNGFLPSVHQGVQLRSEGDPVLYVNNPPGMDRGGRRRSLDVLGELNRMQHEDSGDPETLTRIAQFELAFQMQASVPDLMDITREPRAIRDLYGVEPGKVSFANNCLLARRLLERGTRFVQLFHRGWDTHGDSPANDLESGLAGRCRETDRACAALVKDLKQRGMLDDTLIIWGGEFGRTPMNQTGKASKEVFGRDHHRHAFSSWLAGGGIKPGHIHGETDEFGYHVVKDKVHVHDLQATILHCFGLDHTKLTYRFQGRDYRLTDVYGNVIREILA